MWHLMLLCSLSLLQRLTELWTAYEKEMDTSVSDFLSLHHLGSVLDCLARLGLYIGITTCCGIDSQRPHCCCHLANNICSRWIFSILFNGLGNAPKFPWESGSHLIHGSLDPLESAGQTASWLVQPFWHCSQLCPADTERDTDNGTSVTIDGILCYA